MIRSSILVHDHPDVCESDQGAPPIPEHISSLPDLSGQKANKLPENMTPYDEEVAPICWVPSDPSKTLIYRYCEYIKERFGVSFDPSQDYESLHEWSIKNIEQFWLSIWSFTGIISQQPPSADCVLTLEPSESGDSKKLTRGMYPPAKWFKNISLNYAENLLESHHWKDPSSTAVIQITEYDQSLNGSSYSLLSIRALKEEVRKMAICLKSTFNVKIGDIVAAYAGNRVEVLIFMLAAASIGATFTSVSHDFGPAALLQRFNQLSRPIKVLLTQSSVRYNGKVHNHLEKVTEALDHWKVSELLQKPHVILLSDAAPSVKHPNCLSMDTWDHHLSLVSRQNINSPLTYAQVPFSHPLFILYSSGSTGAPKCIVHGVGGTILQHKKEHMLHGNINSGDVLFQMTTIAWMMWHWSTSALSVGASILLYDGSPWVPNSTFIWKDVISKHQVTHFGTSAKYLALLEEKMACIPQGSLGDLSRLRCIFSTGSPLSASSFKYVYTMIKSDLHLASITGGTDILSLFAGGNPSAPVYLGQIQCKCLGMDVQVWDNSGNRLDDKSSEKGDLVCVQPFPCMPVCFDADPTGSKYREAYFSKFGIWWHGDFLKVHQSTRGIEMLGRSDGTLNPGGVRFGSSEIYQVLTGLFCDKNASGMYFDPSSDALVIGKAKTNKMHPDETDEQVILFVKTMLPWTESLIEKIQQTIKIQLSPRHVPSRIIQVQDIPYTMNGKKAEVVIKKAFSAASIPESELKKLAQGLERPDLIFIYYKLGRELD